MKLRQIISAKNVTIATIFLFFFMLAFFTPFTGDDWAWAGNEGIQRLKEGFSLYNGRYAGNITEIILTRIGIFRPLIMALVTTYIIVKMGQLTNRKPILYIITVLLMLLMPLTTFHETITWIAGYTNYVFPIAIFMTYLVDVKRIVFDNYKPGPVKVVIMFILAIIGQLFVEHMTIYILFASIAAFLYYYIKNQDVNDYLIWYMGGALIGLIIMFSNNAYADNLMHGGPRRIGAKEGDTLLINALRVYAQRISPILVDGFAFINFIISFLLAQRAKKASIINYFSLFIAGLILTNQKFLLLEFDVKMQVILGAILILTNFYLIFKLSFNKPKIGQIAFLYFSAYIVLAPLLIVHPFGSRNFLFSYMLLVTIILMLVDDLNFSSTTNNIILTLCLVMAAQFSYYVIQNYLANDERIICMTKQSDNPRQDTYYLPRVPYEKFLWSSTPDIKKYENRFITYYNLKPKKYFKTRSYEYYQEHQEEICEGKQPINNVNKTK